MKTSLSAYRQSREDLLTNITAKLSSDDRFRAAWLTGSYARNEADHFSDLDLQVVVARPYSDVLCVRKEQVSHKTTEERLALFSQFGQPALIHENNNNAPEGGTFTAILYAESALRIDWILVPQSKVARPFQSRLLFERDAIPMKPAPKPEDLEQSKKSVGEMWAFFWLMTATTIKYIHRDDGVFAAEWIEHLHGLIHEIERRTNREPWKYTRGSLSKLQPTREKQVESIRELCKRMQTLKPRVAEFIGAQPAMPLAEIETLISLADE